MNSEEKNVMVTGVSGTIGDAVARTLNAEGYRACGFDLSKPSAELASILAGHVTGDIRDNEKVTLAAGRVDCVVHLAGWVHSQPSNAQEEDDVFAINRDATNYIANLCEKGGKPIVFASTVAVYGEKTAGILDENAPIAPSTAYGWSKAQAEKAVLKANGTVLRLPMVYGARDRGNMGRMIRAIDKGVFMIPGKGAAKRTFACRWNVARAVAAALREGTKKPGVYLVTDDEDVTLGELVEKIAELLIARKPLRVPKILFGAGAAVGSAVGKLLRRKMPLDWSVYSTLTRDLVFDGSKIRRELDYRPAMSLDQGLSEAVEWFKSKRSLRT